MTESVKKQKLIYTIVDRDNEGREKICGIYTNKKLADKKLKEFHLIHKPDHYYYGIHMDSYTENGGLLKCCIDRKPYI